MSSPKKQQDSRSIIVNVHEIPTNNKSKTLLNQCLMDITERVDIYKRLKNIDKRYDSD